MSEGVATERPREVVWAPNAGPQRMLVTCQVYDTFFGGARGGGKSDGLLGSWLRHWQRWGGLAAGILVRRTMPELEQIEQRFSEVLPKLGCHYQIKRKTWMMPGGTKLLMRYLENDSDAERYQGHEYTWMGIDEMGNFPSPGPIDKLRAALRSTRGVQVMLRGTGNPGGPGHGWIRKRYIDPSPPMVPFQDGRTGTWRVFIPSKLADNPYLLRDPSYVTRLRESGPAWLVRAWLEGDWNASVDGGVVKMEWFRRWQHPPVGGRTVISIDSAQKAGEIHDWSVVMVGREIGGEIYILDVWRRQMELPKLRKAIQDLCERWKPTAVVIEDKGSGTSLLQEFAAAPEFRWSLVGMNPEHDKVIRMSAESAAIEAGRVLIPDSAPWLLDFETEMATFPMAPNDDQVDALSQLLRYLREHNRGLQYAMEMGTW